MTKEEWRTKLLALDILNTTPEQANDICIEYYTWLIQDPSLTEEEPDSEVCHVLYQLDQLQNKLIPEDD